MSAGIRHFWKPLFVVQMETKEVWGLDRTGKRLEEETGFCLASVLKIWVREHILS